MFKKGLAILLTAVTIITSGVVAQPISVQASVFAKTESNSGATNLKECLERTDMSVIHSLETNKNWNDGSVQYVKGSNVYSKKNQFGKGTTDLYDKAFTEKNGYFNIDNPDVKLVSKIYCKLYNKKPIRLYAKKGVFDSKIKEVNRLLGQMNGLGVGVPYLKTDKDFVHSIIVFPNEGASYETDYMCMYMGNGDAINYQIICSLVKRFKENGVDLMSLSELARYEVISELVENNMVHPDDKKLGSDIIDELEKHQIRYKKILSVNINKLEYGSFYNVESDNVLRLYYFYTKEASEKYLNIGVCEDYAEMKSLLASSLGIDARVASSESILDDEKIVDRGHAWVVASVKNSAGKQMTIVDDYGMFTGYGYKRDDLKSDGTSVVGTYESGLSLVKNKNILAGFTIPSSNYSLSDYNDVMAIRTCGILDAAWQKCLDNYRSEIEKKDGQEETKKVMQDYINTLDRNIPSGEPFTAESGMWIYPEDENYFEEWQKYYDYLREKWF